MNANLPIEGTFVLDGMLQGKLPPGDELAAGQRLNDWVTSAGQSGFGFSVEIDGPQFSLLCDNSVRRLPARGVSISRTLADSLNGLFESFPDESRQEFFSTIRSSEFDRNAEIQCVYPVGPEGLINPQERRVEIETASPEVPISGKERLKLGLIAAGVIIAFLAISSFFIDYGKLFGGVRERVTVLKLDDIRFDAELYRPYLEISAESLDRKRGGMILNLKRGEKWETLDSPFVPSEGESGKIRWDELLILSNLKRGYVPCVLYDTRGKAVAEGRIPVASLAENPEGVSFLPLTIRARVERIRLTL